MKNSVNIVKHTYTITSASKYFHSLKQTSRPQSGWHMLIKSFMNLVVGFIPKVELTVGMNPSALEHLINGAVSVLSNVSLLENKLNCLHNNLNLF